MSNVCKQSKDILKCTTPPTTFFFVQMQHYSFKKFGKIDGVSNLE